MASPNLKRGSNAVLYTVLAIGIVVFVNVISSRFFGRLDLTEERIYTLSEASKKLVATLPDRMTVKAFISSDLQPQQLKTIETYIRDLLDEYAAHSKGKLVWEALDPASDEKIQQEAHRLKVIPRPVEDRSDKTKISVAQVYLGVAFQYGGKVEAIPFVLSINDLEYQISSTIRRLTLKKKRKVGFTSGHGEPSTMRGLAAASKSLKDYEVTTVDLTEGKKPIPNDVDLLVMIGPQKPIAARAKYEIDQFLHKGKAVAMFLDGMVLQTPRGQFGHQAPPRIAQGNRIGLAKMLEHYGAKLGTDIIMDRQNQRVRLPAGQGQAVITNYPAFPIVTDLDKENAITRMLKGYVAVFPSSVELTKAAAEGKGGLKGTVLARSSAASWRQTGFFLFDALRQPKPTKELGPFSLAVALAGQIPSYFAGKPTPAVGAAKPGDDKDDQPPKEIKKSPASARLVVFGDAEMIKDQFLGLSRGRNLAVLLNTVDYLAQAESLIAIRAKSQTSRPMENLEDASVTLTQVGNIAGLPAAFVLLGILRWRWRRKRRQQAAEDLRRG